MPIAEVAANYRDVPPPPVKRSTGLDPLILSPILGAPDVVVPLGEYEYESRVSGRKEHLPIVIDIAGLSESDLLLTGVIASCFETFGRPTAVGTGSRIFGQLTKTL